MKLIAGQIDELLVNTSLDSRKLVKHVKYTCSCLQWRIKGFGIYAPCT